LCRNAEKSAQGGEGKAGELANSKKMGASKRARSQFQSPPDVRSALVDHETQSQPTQRTQ